MPKKLSFDQQVTFLHTADLVATHHFYTDLLGLEMVLDQGACRIYRVGGDAFLGFCEHFEQVTERTGIILTLVTDQVDAWYEELVAQGVSFEKPPTLNAKFQIYQAFLRDPNDYLLEIQTFRDPAWPAAAQREA